MSVNKPAEKKDTAPRSSRAWEILKKTLPLAAAAGAIAACVLFPATPFLAIAVEWVAANAIPAFASAYAGMSSFIAITAGIAAAAALSTRLLMAAGQLAFNAFTGKKAPPAAPANDADANDADANDADANDADAPKDLKDPEVHNSPIYSAAQERPAQQPARSPAP